MKFDPYYLPYPSKRQLLYASGGMVASSQPLASQAGMDVMKKGGNAMDAAIACAAALTVLEPYSNGLGGDAFSIIWSANKGRLRGLNASGFAPALLTEENVRAAGWDSMPPPPYGLVPVTVPGIPSAWAAMIEKYGNLPLTVCCASRIKPPKIAYKTIFYPANCVGSPFIVVFMVFPLEKP
jgi:gamma-glutamyltranspeptidase/glutathione hydrolase